MRRRKRTCRVPERAKGRQNLRRLVPYKQELRIAGLFISARSWPSSSHPSEYQIVHSECGELGTVLAFSCCCLMDKFSKARFACAVLATAIIAAPVSAAPERVIKPGAKKQTFPIIIQQERQHLIRFAEPKENETPRPAGAGIDECPAHCPNGVGW